MKYTQINYYRNTLTALTTLLWLTTSTHAATNYKFSLTPRFSAQEILTRFGPLTKLLGEKLHSEVEIVLASNFDDYEIRLKSGQFDIAFSNPNHYSKASATHEVIAIGAKNDEARVRGLIITRADSKIKSIQDLIGKDVAIVSWESTFGFLSQKVFLEEQGINPKTQIKLQEAHDNKQENVIFSVYQGDVVAGFINEDALHIVDHYVPPNQIRIVTATSWLPDWALSVKRTMPQMAKARIREALLELNLNNPVIKALKLQNFVAATDADYDLIRKALGINPTPITVTNTPQPCVPVTSAATNTTTPTPAAANAIITNAMPIPIPVPIPIKTNDTQPTVANAADTTNTANPTSPTQEEKTAVKKSSRKRKNKSKR